MFLKDKNAYVFLILATLFWSGNFIVGKAATLFEIPPFTLNFYRWTFAWLILAPFTLHEIIQKKKQILQDIKLIFILGITSITIFNSIVYYSLNFTQVISGVLMISTIPVMIIFFSWIFFVDFWPCARSTCKIEFPFEVRVDHAPFYIQFFLPGYA